MMKVGFVVEGPSDKCLLESDGFKRWLQQACGMVVVSPVVNAGGNGQMCSRKISVFVEKLRIQAMPDKIVVLADLDPDACAPCITKRKEIIGDKDIDLVVIAKKAMESWFLADTQAMRRWTENKQFFEPQPEEIEIMPWDRLKDIGKQFGRGPGASKKIFARKFIRDHGFDIQQAAQHPACPSARYFVERLCALSGD